MIIDSKGFVGKGLTLKRGKNTGAHPSPETGVGGEKSLGPV